MKACEIYLITTELVYYGNAQVYKYTVSDQTQEIFLKRGFMSFSDSKPGTRFHYYHYMTSIM